MASLPVSPVNQQFTKFSFHDHDDVVVSRYQQEDDDEMEIDIPVSPGADDLCLEYSDDCLDIPLSPDQKSHGSGFFGEEPVRTKPIARLFGDEPKGMCRFNSQPAIFPSCSTSKCLFGSASMEDKENILPQQSDYSPPSSPVCLGSKSKKKGSNLSLSSQSAFSRPSISKPPLSRRGSVRFAPTVASPLASKTPLMKSFSQGALSIKEESPSMDISDGGFSSAEKRRKSVDCLTDVPFSTSLLTDNGENHFCASPRRKKKNRHFGDRRLRALSCVNLDPMMVEPAHHLPTISGMHSDLKTIDARTMYELLEGKFKDCFDEVHIVDCRFPYEFKGGHIKGSVNLDTQDDLMDYFLQERCGLNKRVAVVLYCEFSHKRGPQQARFLRNCDRKLNEHRYPKLYYPEVYLLEGGYKGFWGDHKSHCSPQGYVKMDSRCHEPECKERMEPLRRSWKRSNSLARLESLKEIGYDRLPPRETQDMLMASLHSSFQRPNKPSGGGGHRAFKRSGSCMLFSGSNSSPTSPSSFF